MSTLDDFIKKLPERRQRRIARGDRLFKYIIEKRCKHPEMLDNDASDTGVAASPKVRGVGK